MDLPDPGGEGRVLHRSPRWWPLSPGVVARARDAQNPAQKRDGMVGLLRVDEPKTAHRIPSSRAKKAVAFLKTSFSCSRTLTFLLRRPSSSRSWVVSPSRSPSSISVLPPVPQSLLRDIEFTGDPRQGLSGGAHQPYCLFLEFRWIRRSRWQHPNNPFLEVSILQPSGVHLNRIKPIPRSLPFQDLLPATPVFSTLKQ